MYLNKDNLLKLKNRRIIYNTIEKHPGLHIRELSEKTKIPFNTLRYHLNYLVKKEIIECKHHNHFQRYYLYNRVGRKDKALINLFRQEIPRKIILLLSICEKNLGYSMKEIKKLTCVWKSPYDKIFQIKKHRSTLGFHVNKLVDLDIIECKRTGKKFTYKIKDSEYIWNFLIIYQYALSDELVDIIIRWYNNYNIPMSVDYLMNNIWECFPHPYYG